MELCLRFFQLASHLVIPLLDTVKYACIFIILVLPDLLLRLPNLFLLELGQFAVVARKLFDLVVRLRCVLLVHAVAVRAIVGEGHDFDNDLLEGVLEETAGDAPLRALGLRFGLGYGFFVLVDGTLACARFSSRSHYFCLLFLFLWVDWHWCDLQEAVINWLPLGWGIGSSGGGRRSWLT